MKEQYINKIYSGWLGKMIGVVHGSNIEGWTREEIERTFGEITDYPFRFKNFCADDDINGPAFFQRAVLDYGPELKLRDLADTFLNYVSDGHGFFWWGGYGISTEDTAYHNLVEGISPELSGSARLNGPVLANQIGGQIFSDCWGLACPGDPHRAANLAERMASLTHDQEGRAGARFVAAAIAAAFEADSVEEILEQALAQVPEECDYRAMAEDVRDYTCAHREDWKACFDYVKERYDYRFYPGVCHIIPNAAVMVLALLAGKGSFKDTINIAAMCGWDTDCNEGNLGTILGVFAGPEGLCQEWIPQIHDLAICSSSLGGRNIQTVPQLAETTLRVAKILEDGCGQSKEAKTDSRREAEGRGNAEEEEVRNKEARELSRETAQIWERILAQPEGQYLHFQFPGSTQALRVGNVPDCSCVLKNVRMTSPAGTRALAITHPGFGNNGWFTIFYKTYYRPSDFDDNRYQPDLSPIVYPGDVVLIDYCFEKEDFGKKLLVQAYMKNRIRDREEILWTKNVVVSESGWQQMKLEIPAEDNLLVEEIGVRITGQQVAVREKTSPFRIYLGGIKLLPQPDFKMEASHLFQEIWTAVDTNPVGFSYLRGAAEVWNGIIGLSGAEKPAELYTGSCNWKDYQVEAVMKPISGPEHYLLARVQGAMRWYGAGFLLEDGRKYAAILKKNRQITPVTRIPWEWNREESYRISLEVRGNRILFRLDGKEILEYTDEVGFYKTGCIGMGNCKGSRTQYLEYSVRGIA